MDCIWGYRGCKGVEVKNERGGSLVLASAGKGDTECGVLALQSHGSWTLGDVLVEDSYELDSI